MDRHRQETAMQKSLVTVFTSRKRANINSSEANLSLPFSLVAAEQCLSAQPDACFRTARPACICQAGVGDTALSNVGAEIQYFWMFLLLLDLLRQSVFPVVHKREGSRWDDHSSSQLPGMALSSTMRGADTRLVSCPALPRPASSCTGGLNFSSSNCDSPVSSISQIARTASPICGVFSFIREERLPCSITASRSRADLSKH